MTTMYMSPPQYPFFSPHGMTSMMPPGAYPQFMPMFTGYPGMYGSVMPMYGGHMMGIPDSNGRPKGPVDSFPPGIRPPYSQRSLGSQLPGDVRGPPPNGPSRTTSLEAPSELPRFPPRPLRKYSYDGYSNPTLDHSPGMDQSSSMRRRYNSDQTGGPGRGPMALHTATFQPRQGRRTFDQRHGFLPFGPVGMHPQHLVSSISLPAKNELHPWPAPPEPVHDPLLEQYKADKDANLTLQEIQGHVYHFAVDQHGSRCLQQQLESASADELNEALNEVLPKALYLMTDVFGNYVMQKFLENCGPQQLRGIVDAMRGHVLHLSLQMYGCRVVQKALEVWPLELQTIIAQELEGHAMHCVQDQNGNHVIQKCIECIPSAHATHLLNELLPSIATLSTHPFGCRVVQRILEHCNQEEVRRQVLDDIVKAACQLATDQYGNYVVQHVLELGAPDDQRRMIQRLRKQLFSFSFHKYASNVVEKCLIACPPDTRDNLIMEVAHLDRGSSEPLEHLMCDQFGNYVVHRMLEVCEPEAHEMLTQRVQAQIAVLKKHTHSRHILARVEKLVSAGVKPPRGGEEEEVVVQEATA